jgi:hypothetical protein
MDGCELRLLRADGRSRTVQLTHAPCFLLPAPVAATGQVFTFGSSQQGQLGHPGDHDADRYRPTLVSRQRVVVSLCSQRTLTAAGVAHDFAARTATRLPASGLTLVVCLSQVEALKDVVITSVSCGPIHTACISGEPPASKLVTWFYSLMTWCCSDAGELYLFGFGECFYPTEVS